MSHEIHIQQVKKVHFIGVGGIGISAVARMMMLEGKIVSGSDGADSKLLEDLRTQGMQVYLGHSEEHVSSDCDLVIYTIAISKDNPELTRAHELGIPAISYPEALGLISKNKYTIAVSGTHGKTTTTAMIAKILIDADKDPTVIVGSLLKHPRTNFIAGKSDFFVVEACEYRRSFLNLNPTILVINNIEEDHLDYYKDIEDIKSAFREIVTKVPHDGYVVCNMDDEVVMDAVEGATCKIVDTNLISTDFKLAIPGRHNIKNARSAISVATLVGISEEEAKKSLKMFEGTWRRAEFKGEIEGEILIFDDYAHHPTEIRATLSGFKEKYPDRKRVVIFQPHLYSRTKQLFAEFVESFDDADAVVLLPIYAAREPFDPSISCEMLKEAMKDRGVEVYCVETFDEASEKALDVCGNNGLILTMGAGDVYKISEKLCYTTDDQSSFIG